MKIFFFAAATLAATLATAAPIEVYDLRCDLMNAPLGVDSELPKLSWKLRSLERGQRQTAWQLIAASSPALLAADSGDLWSSGRRSSDQQLNLPYEGRALKSSEQVFWKVRVWGSNGEASPWSATASWTMGILSPREWRAQWITDANLLPWLRKKVGYKSLVSSREDDEKWLTIDLGKAYSIQAVRLYPVRQLLEEAQGFPLRFRIDAANNAAFKNATPIADYTDKDFPYSNTTHKTTVPSFDAPSDGSANARYLRIVATKLRQDNGKFYLALFQIEVVADGKNVAAGAKVSAKDSDESGMWSRQALTDGLEVRGANPGDNSSLLLRREFAVKPALKRALVHVSGLGHYELRVNGSKVGESLLTPGWTTYEKTVLYDTYDLTAMLHAGAKNAIGITLAGGMYNVRADGKRYVKFESLFHPLVASCHLQLDYADGSSETLLTDPQWRCSSAGAITFSNIFGGEDYDARIAAQMGKWDAPNYDDKAWKNAAVASGLGTLRGASHAAPPMRTYETLTPLRLRQLKPDTLVYDLGQNASIMPRIRVRGPKGAVIKLTPSELLHSNGTLNRGSQTRGTYETFWQYTLNGDTDGELWMPQFFYHGARYLQATLLPAVAGGDLPAVEELEGVVVHSASPAAGEFACSNELFNRVHTLVRWAQRSNTMSVLTDCPHREKLGWLEQYHLNGPAMMYEFDLAQLFRKTFGDMADAQTTDGLVPDIAPEYVIFSNGFRDSPEWGSAFILAAWQQYLFTADLTVFQRYYPAMCRYASYLRSKAKDGILDFGLGDWYDVGPKGPGFAQLTPVALTATATFYEDLKTLSSIAALLGKADDAKRYADEAATLRRAYNSAFWDKVAGVYATGSQCANAISLVFGLAEPHDRDRIVSALVSDVDKKGLTAGDVGYRYLLRALADAGRSDVIYRLNNQSAKPGYGYQLAQGATSLPESWKAGKGSSHNHFMLGQINEWFYHDLAGIRPDAAAPGFRHIIIAPQPANGLQWATATYRSPYGDIVSSWKKEAGQFVLELSIPAGTTATVHFPNPDVAVADEALGIISEKGVLELPSGTYKLLQKF
ncbi:MAG: family 78 glycoside hydrolase catalytic domain [Prevotellaceae bacterium]|jgi:hypothetical protein|nr:family 78 glycoside hydrolase catalytic domain [Prevotellaceae bacterium]